MRPIQFVWTPLRQLALRRLSYHLIGMAAAIVAAILSTHQDAPLLTIFRLSWEAYRMPALLYILGYAQQSAKTAEDTATAR